MKNIEISFYIDFFNMIFFFIILIFYAGTFSFTCEIIYPYIPLFVDFCIYFAHFKITFGEKNFKVFTNLLEVGNGRSYFKMAPK